MAERRLLTGNFLGSAQKAHLQRFSAHNSALRAKFGRLLARMAALHFLPPASVLDIDAFGKPRLDNSIKISFSYSSSAAFCLLCDSPKSANLPDMAIDAEVVEDRQFSTNPRNRRALQKIFAKFFACKTDLANACRLWTIYEACLKTGDARKAPSGKAETCGHSGKLATPAGAIYWRSLAFLGHWLSLAQQDSPPGKINVCLFDPLAPPADRREKFFMEL